MLGGVRPAPLPPAPMKSSGSGVAGPTRAADDVVALGASAEGFAVPLMKGGPLMNLHEAPAFLAVKLATLSDGCATATIKADQLTAQISDLRDRLNGRVIRAGDHPEKLRIELERLLEEQKTLQRQRPIEADILGRCRAWLAALPPGTVLEQVTPAVEDGLPLPAVRTRIKKLQDSVAALKRVPIPAPNIREKVQTYVERLPMPSIDGIAAGESLSVQWPTGPHALMAFLQPDVLV